MAGVLGIVLGTFIPVLGIVLTGFFAVYFYRRKRGFAPRAAVGARLGAAAGLVVFAVNALFTLVVIALHMQSQCIDAMAQFLQKFGVNTANPQFQASMNELFTGPGLARSFLVMLVLTAIGGALATTVLRQSPKN